jgi:glutamate/tyrosine decarboxylase-like PLP-dependent enzyme
VPAEASAGAAAGEDLEPVFEALVQQVLSFRDQHRCDRVLEEVSPAEVRERLAASYDFEHPIELDGLRAEVGELLNRWTVDVTHPAYFGLFNPQVDPAGIVADTLVALYNPQLAAWSHAAAANEIERLTLDHLGSLLWPESESTIASFTSGGAEANLSAVIVALSHQFPEFGNRGARALPGAPRMYASEESHHSLLKIAHFTGIGREALQLVPTGSDLRLDAGALERAIGRDLAAGALPFLVVGTAGTTSAGVIDPLPALAGICERHGMWLHVDAAWGGTACISPRLRDSLAGIEAADSVTWDAHKWLSVPMGAGMFFCRHPEAVGRAFRASTGYMPGDTTGAVDPYSTTAQWSRRFTGLKVFMTLARLGRQRLVERIERQAEMGDLLRAGLEQDGWEIVNRTPLPVVCFQRPELAGPESYDALVKFLYERGRVWISVVALPGIGPALRACITSYETGRAELELLRSELLHGLENAG